MEKKDAAWPVATVAISSRQFPCSSRMHCVCPVFIVKSGGL